LQEVVVDLSDRSGREDLHAGDRTSVDGRSNFESAARSAIRTIRRTGSGS
jgi:hypothetical protein